MGPAGAALRDGGGPPPAPPPVPEAEGLSRVVAAFDLDGTLTRGDTLAPFLLRVAGPAALGRALAALGGRLALGLTGDARRDAAKEALLARLLAGREEAVLAAAGEAFADDVVAGRVAAARLRPDTTARLAWHQAQGHGTVIVSASPELYVAPLGRRLGVDAVLATRLEVGPDGRLTGRFCGVNCRAAEKAVRLRDHLGDEPARLYAYGDSKGDAAMLAMAHTALRVGRRPIAPGAAG